MNDDKVNILLVDDQPAKLLTYEAILRDLGENLLTAMNAREALEILLKNEVAVVLVDVYMPETDGFQLAAMIRDHPRFQKTAIIFISAVLLADVDRLRGYEMGAVDYVPVPVIPEMLRAKVGVFIELYRKTRELEKLNRELEGRVAERTTALAESTLQLHHSEQLHSLALAAGQMGSWTWNAHHHTIACDQGQLEIFGVDSDSFVPTLQAVQALIDPDDLPGLMQAIRHLSIRSKTYQTEFRIRRPSGEVRWCTGAAAASFDNGGRLIWLSGVTVDITDRKLAEERQMLLAGEVDHRARNVVAVIQSIVRSTRAATIDDYIVALEGRVRALSSAHKLLAKSRWEGADLTRLVKEEFAPYNSESVTRASFVGPKIVLSPAMAQTIALAVHELATNAAKYGALSAPSGRIDLRWARHPGALALEWTEQGGPKIEPPTRKGYGTRVVTAGIERQLGGQVDFSWQADGLRCTIQVPFGDNPKPVRPERKAAKASAPPAQAIANTAILLVEDEPLVSMMLADMLSDLGHTVDGPYSRISDAMRSARNGSLRAGVLDINVGGEPIYCLADELTRRNIPFVFVTGYSADSVDARFSHVPIVQKPVEQRILQAALSTTAFDRS
jgi:PAS domain S-box-containing protein